MGKVERSKLAVEKLNNFDYLKKLRSQKKVTMTKIEALAKHLECDKEEVDSNDEYSFDYRNGRESYLVLTDSEADKFARETILDSVWAFNPDFLAAHSDMDSDDIELIQSNGKCEDNNKLLTKLINDLDHFVTDAIMSDGRGHFLSTYDGEEIEIEAGEYYIYRTN